MIARPLDLASRLRPEPRNFDWLHYVNAGLLGLFFTLFGSPFVLAPGLGVDFQLPIASGARLNAKPATHHLTVLATGQILTSHGKIELEKLEAWLREQIRGTRESFLLVRGDRGVPMATIGAISSAAKRAGFHEVTWAMADAPDTSGGR